MKIEKLMKLLEENSDIQLYIMLPSGEFVPEHFHITEVGRVQKMFVDCGGVFRKSASCVLQVWTANDVEHRIKADKLFKILKFAEKAIELDDLTIEIEYGADVAASYFVVDVEVTPKGLLFILSGKQTECLAPDKCGVKGCC